MRRDKTCWVSCGMAGIPNHVVRPHTPHKHFVLSWYNILAKMGLSGAPG